MPKSLPTRADFEQLRKQAKDLVKAHGASDPSVCATLREHPRFPNSSDAQILAARVSLQQVQHALAREYGFRSWTELKQQVEAVRPASLTLPLTDSAQHIVDQIPTRARDRGLFFLDSASIVALTLWSLIRWERKVALAVLEGMGVDMSRLTSQLDSFLDQMARENPTPGAEDAPSPSGRGGPMIYFDMEPLLDAFLGQASLEASQLGHSYVGSEHLLLAIISATDGEPSLPLKDHLPSHESAKEAILEFLGE